jgi:hypothetical protein
MVASNDRLAVNPFAKLLGLAPDDEDEDATPRSAVTAAPAALRVQPKPATVASVAPAPATTSAAMDKKPAPAKIADAAVNKPAAESGNPKVVQVAALLSAAPAPAASETADVASAAGSANQIIRTRGYWQGPPDGMAVATAPAARPARRDTSSKPDSNSEAAPATGAIGPFNNPRDGAAPPLTFAYAAQPEAYKPTPAVTSASPSGAAVTALRAAATSADPQIRAEQALYTEQDASAEKIAPSGTTIAMKRAPNQVASAILSTRASSVVAITTGVRLENPWLRAVLAAPSVHRFLTTLALGVRDFRTLAALMVKPRSAVMMTFAADPYPGLEHERFSGPAVVFVSTISYPAARTAAVQQ